MEQLGNYIPSSEEGCAGRTIYFDMDSTLEKESDLRYTNMLKDFKEMGYRIGIIATDKQQWTKVQELSSYIDSFQLVPQGSNKYEAVQDKTGILVTNNDHDLSTWYSDHIKIETAKN